MKCAMTRLRLVVAERIVAPRPRPFPSPLRTKTGTGLPKKPRPASSTAVATSASPQSLSNSRLPLAIKVRTLSKPQSSPIACSSPSAICPSRDTFTARSKRDIARHAKHSSRNASHAAQARRAVVSSYLMPGIAPVAPGLVKPWPTWPKARICQSAPASSARRERDDRLRRDHRIVPAVERPRPWRRSAAAAGPAGRTARGSSPRRQSRRRCGRGRAHSAHRSRSRSRRSARRRSRPARSPSRARRATGRARRRGPRAAPSSPPSPRPRSSGVKRRP